MNVFEKRTKFLIFFNTYVVLYFLIPISYTYIYITFVVTNFLFWFLDNMNNNNNNMEILF